MLNTLSCRGGIVTSPHHLASQTGVSVLREGGSAIEAAVAMAATLAVVSPHMTGLGGDGFWLLGRPGRPPMAIDSAGAAGQQATIALYRRLDRAAIPWRGPLAAITVAGAVSGWAAALTLDRSETSLPLARLLDDAIQHAEAGIVVTEGQATLTERHRDDLSCAPGFADAFLPAGGRLERLAVLKQPALAKTLRRLTEDGLDSFYRGRTAAAVGADLVRLGAPLGAADLAAHVARLLEPLSVKVRGAEVFNVPPPTQGLASLLILAVFDRLSVREGEGFDHLHGLVEATKQAFRVRDREVADPAWMRCEPAELLRPEAIGALAARIDRERAAAWPAPADAGDTVWFGAVDASGCSASVIQSLYFEYGSGVVLPETGVVWHNRGAAFDLNRGPNLLRPGARPRHTLNPALARFDDGRELIYGTMGGEGQPQTQAAIFSRYGWYGMQLQEAVTAPRWLLGRTWGEDSTALKLESRFDESLCADLVAAGHRIERVEAFSSLMGHAGAIVRHPNGVLEGAADPRTDGAVAGC